jgi:hypothetical protein
MRALAVGAFALGAGAIGAIAVGAIALEHHADVKRRPGSVVRVALGISCRVNRQFESIIQRNLA